MHFPIRTYDRACVSFDDISFLVAPSPLLAYLFCFHSVVGIQCRFSCDRVVDYWDRIGSAEFNARHLEYHGIHVPGSVDVIVGKVRNFRNPFANVISMGIKFLTLHDGIEDPEIGSGIGTASRNPLPSHGVICQVRIDQSVPEPFRSQFPVQQEMLDQKGSYDHAHPIVHPPGRPQLAHAGVYDGVAGLAFLPGQEHGLILSPWESFEFRSQWTFGHVWEMVEQVMGKFTPSHFLHIGGKHHRGSRTFGAAGCRFQMMVDLPWSNLSKVQVG